MNGVKQVSLVDEQPEVEQGANLPAVQTTPNDVVGMVERLAANPAVDVVKLEKIIELQERILAHNAKAEFDSAFSEMQGEIPIVTEDGKIVVNGQTRSKYAKHEDIQRIVKPILQKHGFALRFRNEQLEGGRLKIVGILSHRSGHSEEDQFITAPDDSGSKNSIQAIGSARSYGQRYCTISLLNIATEGIDDDGRKATQKDAPKPPKGFTEQLVADLEAAADEGWPVLQKVWKSWTQEQRDYLNQINRDLMNKLKAKAQKVKVQA